MNENAELDRAWRALSPRVERHLSTHGAALEIEITFEPVTDGTARLVARISDGTKFYEPFSVVRVAAEQLKQNAPPIRLTPEIASRVAMLREQANIASVEVLTADIHSAQVLVTPIASKDAPEGDWAQPLEPYMLLIDPALRHDRTVN